jgi:hypothetical protein
MVQTREQTARRLTVVLSNFVNEIFQSLLLGPGQKPATSNPPFLSVLLCFSEQFVIGIFRDGIKQ